MGTTKQKPIETQKIKKKEWKYIMIENHEIAKEKSKRRKRKKGTAKQPEDREQTVTST